MKCSIHSARNLIPCNTRYGIRYSCPVGGCTVVSWNGNSPADYGTRQTRIKAHEAFDHLWKSGMLKRGDAYKKLAKFLGVHIEETHIANFDIEQCQKVIEFGNDIWRDKL
jgi:hypothetical protein